MTDTNERPLRLAVDIGGTFVDALAYDETTGRVSLHKASTTPAAPAAGVMEAVRGLAEDLAPVAAFVHGTTLGLNAILQRRGADVGIITNEGFRDLFEVARAAIPADHMYDFSYAPPPVLVPRRHRLGVPGRMDAQGGVVRDLDEDAVREAGRVLVEEHGLGSIAVCFLHSYANPEHEQRAGAVLREAFPHVSVSLSTDITREYREYERTSTAVMDAYIRPVLNDYISALEAGLRDKGLADPLHIMRSGGGAMTSGLARSAPLTTVLSGPAGGVVGAGHLASVLGIDRLLSFDVGGTSIDSCVIVDGEPSEVHEADIDGFPLLIPIFDLRTIGAGGGSIAWVDDGLLRVGPHSAGAVPGPVAYGQGGTEPTVTDAALTLGYLDAAEFLGGRMGVDADAAAEAVRHRIAEPLGVDTAEAAASVFRVMMARSVGALREITVERGLDPREFTLLAFGGAGPMLGPMLAREMGIATTVVPRVPAAFSAFGMLMSDLEYEFSGTVLRPLDEDRLAGLAPVFGELEDQARAVLAEQGIREEQGRLVRRVDVRYRGQEHTLGIDLEPGDTAAAVRDRFHALHRSRYGHAMDEPCEVMTVRVRAVGRLPKPALAPQEPARGPAVACGSRKAFDLATGAVAEFAVHRREDLAPGHRVAGPAIVEEGTATTVLFGDQVLTLDAYGHLLVTAAGTDSDTDREEQE
ncbi:hydantoinase/oxoprolinase family protein [Nocardiopsis changdeensis]|uniref:Hydantoinase/oxoprolinase family protein n=1 Tax=Nocardiopsis changdeensis TaxID=2831969 RepID=A0ABX8BI47_9ACTN|nr:MULTISPECIES: hydantoinase/oxoprolinase family protein [Nocardiopsis]QUX20707.1 hydantoinase/oxoprolinase family protein [Nocardiopsis changdeensis]QYX36639.1 hydantoinase/oxoprolinase family protein [Nocardiopsis sp. MT53]